MLECSENTLKRVVDNLKQFCREENVVVIRYGKFYFFKIGYYRLLDWFRVEYFSNLKEPQDLIRMFIQAKFAITLEKYGYMFLLVKTDEDDYIAANYIDAEFIFQAMVQSGEITWSHLLSRKDEIERR